MDAVTIEQLKVNATAPLGALQKKALVEILNQEFNSQSTLYNAKADEQREKILEQYRKGVGYTTLKTAYDKAEADKRKAKEKMHDIERQMNLKGLSKDGQRHNPYSGFNGKKDEALVKAHKKLTALLKIVEESSPSRIRNKIVSRMWLAETNGEACVILQSVLGNGIIPPMTQQQLLEAPATDVVQ